MPEHPSLHRLTRRGGALGVGIALLVAAAAPAAAATGAQTAAPQAVPQAAPQAAPQVQAPPARVGNRAGVVSSLTSVVAANTARRLGTVLAAMRPPRPAGARHAWAVKTAATLNSTVSYVETNGAASRIVRVNPGTASGVADPLTIPVRSVAWSADGSRYAYATGNGVATLRANGSSPVTLDTRASLGALAWHQRGFEVAGTVSVAGTTRIMIAKSDGSSRWVIDGKDGDGKDIPGAVPPLEPTTLTYLPDEISLAVTAQDPSTHLSRIERLDTVTERTVRILPDDPSSSATGVQQRDPVLSPDGTQLAYIQQLTGAVQSIWVMGTDGSNARHVMDATVAPGGLAWRPDGSGIYALTTGPNTLRSVTVADGTATTLAANLPNSVSSLSVRPTAVAVSGDRFSGLTAIQTAISVSQNAFVTHPASGPPSCEAAQALSVILVRSDAFPDGLVGSPLAAKKCGPLLLTPPTALDPAVLTEIKRVLQPGATVYVIGDTHAISAAAQSTLVANHFTVVRFAGTSAYSTAAAVARYGLGTPSVVLLANGLDYADGLVAGPAAAALGGAVLLTNGTLPHISTDNYLNGVAGVRAAAIGNQAATAYPWAYKVAGLTRYDTAAAVAREYFYPPRVAFLAYGRNYPDAMSGGALAAITGNPLITTPQADLDPAMVRLLDAGSAATSFVIAIGGTPVVSATALAHAVTLSGGAEPWVGQG